MGYSIFGNTTSRVLKRRQRRFVWSDLAGILSGSSRLHWLFINRRKLSRFVGEFNVLLSMLNDYYHRRYKAVPWHIVTMIGATLLYVLSPIDMIPDFIPFLGFADDASVFLFCLNMITKDMDKYKNWKEQNEVQA